MIIDRLENIAFYYNISGCVVDFIKNIQPDISLGRHVLTDNIYANVETYETKDINDGKFETHDNYIDIQFLLSGDERIYIANRRGLNISAPYDKSKDITFYSDSLSDKFNVKLDGSNFVVLFPHEAHAPQISTGSEKDKVLKVVIKIKVK